MTVFVDGSLDAIVLRADLAPGELAYIDGAWTEHADETPRAVAAIHYLAGSLQFANGPLVELPKGMDPDTAARMALASVAGEAASAVAGIDPELVVVTGRGIVAADVEQLLGISRDQLASPGQPRAVVETTGSPVVLVDALEGVADLGVVVLAGEMGGRELDYDFYPHIHVRGLEAVGVAPPLSGTIAWTAGRPPGVPPWTAQVGFPLAPNQLWYRLSRE